MKRLTLLLALALSTVLSLALIGPAGAAPGTTAGGGNLSLSVHAHSSEFGSPSGGTPLFATSALSFDVPRGDFSYSAIPCSQPARFNDRSLTINPTIPGIVDQDSTRSLVEGTVVHTNGQRGTVEGTITTILCRGGAETDNRIVTNFASKFKVVSDNELQFHAGRYRIASGTGLFDSLSGRGSLTGAITCQPPVLARNGADSCADLGAFSDLALQLTGGLNNSRSHHA